MASLVGRTLGKYRVVARLGRGGMAEVYKAYQPGLNRYIGIKVLHSHLVDDQDFVGRFEREALAVGRLRHPNIVQAVDFERDGETYFMAMEFIDGPTLKDEVKARKAANQPFTMEEVSRIFTGLCSAIDYAHGHGMVHRDVKPANVMINNEGQVVLTDFGIARIMGATQFTQTGALSGTPAYMSPEQGQGERGDERSDIYSLGIMLYEMVTGMVPYDADTPFAVIMKHISEPLPLPTKVNSAIPESVERVILKAMAKEQDDRYQTAGELAIDLRNTIGVSPDDNLQRTPLVIVAPPLNIDQIDHPTGPITTRERTLSSTKPDGQTTAWMGGNAGAPPAKKGGLLPVLLGGGIIIIVMLIGFIAFLIWSSNNATTNQKATADAETASALVEAQTAVAATAEVAANATTDANEAATEVALLAPAQTAEAELVVAEAVAATETAMTTQNENIMAGIAATTTSDAATSQAATAEVIANFTATPLPTETPLPLPTATTTPTHTPVAPLVPAAPTDTPTPANTPIPARAPLSGKIAFPVDNGTGNYNVMIASVSDAKIIGEIVGARQPHFRNDGKKLLVNGQGGGFGENVFEASPTGAIERSVSGSPSDMFPIYKFDGTTIAYSNPQLAFGSQGYESYIFVQCSVNPPAQESDPKCAAVADFLVIVPAGTLGDIIGSYPVWTTGDRIVYRGCDTWKGGGSCGLFTVGSWATKRSSNGENPQKIIDGTSNFPTDAKAGLVAFQSHESGSWEAYIMGEGGDSLINISDSPTSNDGLPAISPGGQWVAFASDREGAWAIFVAPVSGGSAEKLIDFPKADPWGTGDNEWFNERISWGP